MANNKPDQSENIPIITSARQPYNLNNFSHRKGKDITVAKPADAITEATPAQRERIVYLVDDAIDVIEDSLHGPSMDLRFKAAQDVMDRAQIHKKPIASKQDQETLSLPAHVLVDVINGLAQAFGAKPSKTPILRDITPPKEPEPARIQPKKPSGLPDDLLSRYEE